MKLLVAVFLLFTNLALAKECFKDKQSGKLICYERYFERYKIHKAQDDEKYYTSPSSKIYAIGDKIEVKFKAIGAILTILDDYEIDFIDKTKGEKFIFQVRNKDEVFVMLRKLNDLKAVQKALPITTQKFTKKYVEYIRQRREEKLEKIKDKLANPEKKKPAINKMKGGKIEGSFLKGTAK